MNMTLLIIMKIVIINVYIRIDFDKHRIYFTNKSFNR